MSDHEVQLQERVRQEAADWFIANRETLDASRETEFMRWLRASPAHVEEYLGMALTARDLSAAAAKSTVPIEPLLQEAPDAGNRVRQFPRDRSSPRRTTPTWHFAAMAAAVGGVLALGPAWWMQHNGTEPAARQVLAEVRYETQHGQRLTRHLYDGSTVHLNTDTAVTIAMGPRLRRVTIEHGQATFEVAHDPERDFRVITPGTEIADLGTNFDVYVGPESTLVTVVAGRVSVEPSAVQRARTAERRSNPLVVEAGQQLRVADGAWPGTVVNVDAQQITAWLRGRLAFTQQPLGAVATEFNRYAAVPIVIETPALRALPVSGVFAVDNDAAFIAFLRSLDGVHVELTPAQTRVWQ